MLKIPVTYASASMNKIYCYNKNKCVWESVDQMSSIFKHFDISYNEYGKILEEMKYNKILVNEINKKRNIISFRNGILENGKLRNRMRYDNVTHGCNLLYTDDYNYNEKIDNPFNVIVNEKIRKEIEDFVFDSLLDKTRNRMLKYRGTEYVKFTIGYILNILLGDYINIDKYDIHNKRLYLCEKEMTLEGSNILVIGEEEGEIIELDDMFIYKKCDYNGYMCEKIKKLCGNII